MEVNAFKGAIYSRFTDASAFAEKLGWSKQRVSYFVNGVREPKLSDIQEMAKALNMDVVEVASFFLREESQKCDDARQDG